MLNGQIPVLLAALQDLIMGSTLLKCAATDVGIQWAGWALAAALKTEKFYDLAGSGTFILLAHLSRMWGGANHIRQKVQTGLVTAWGLRLGTFLFLRILKDGHDRRFNNVRDSPGTFFVYWTVQAMWVFMTLLPTLLLNSERRDVPLGTRDYVGWALWGFGFATEAIADQQKWIFKSDPNNAGKFIQSGLWAYSRHPNYLGEILQWSGLWLSASSVMAGPQYLSVASPLFVWFLLRYVSGIPMLEKQALRKWGSDPAFQHYTKNTPLLWPFPKF
ncbi:uncharacterized protein si:ch211-210c8.6 [Takifugu flavidus]|uniref:Uncharacterized protein n=2 Tax=Takifugu TaxID=31032 RepID=A0A5C6MUK6_9TELE|nr:uncharacterized protein si:ch211-210c8.6 [Takifugu flavidus]TNM86773.1 hypothetical protein fugu_007003 [Takifugu bimaculatus]TWW57027.1 hypothetical protein D4764_08G0010140 [Takifugu flavidus]